MSHLAKFKQIRRINRSHQGTYRGQIDVAKTFVLRYATTHKQIGNALAGLKTMALSLKALSNPVHLRIPGSDFLVLREIFELGEYSAAMNWPMPEEARIVDLGGNIGLATLFFSTLVPKGKFLVVEPDEANCRMIQRNCALLLESGQLQIARGFVAAQDGVAGIERAWSKSWAFRKVDTIDDQHEAVACFSMATLLATAKFEQIDILKCDIEGTEKELFRDCKEWISRVEHLIIEVHHPYLLEDLYNDLRANGWPFTIAEEHQGKTQGVAFLKRN